MPRIPLPLGYKGSENLPRSNQILQNCFNDQEGHILPRPGITSLKDTGLIARGQFEWNEALYQVISTSLIKITDETTGDYSVIGTVAGPDPIQTAIGFNDAVIVVPGGAIYTLSTSDVLTNISVNPNFVACADVCHINGRFVYIPSSGDPAFFSNVGIAGTVDADAFFDAEELPDKNNACFNLNNTLYIMGTDSIELFRDTGADPNPFARVDGALIRNGYIGGLLEYDNTFLFIGRQKDQNAGIFAIGRGEAPKISNSRIDLILDGYPNEALAEAIPGRIIWRGHDIATFSLRGNSFGYYKGEWFLLDTVLSGISRPWAAGFITEFGGSYWTAYSGKIGKFAKINTDYSERITRRIGSGVYHDNGNFISVQSIEVSLSQGFNTASGKVALRMSRDNVTWGPYLFISLGAIGQYTHILKWNPPGGLGNYRGFFGYEIYCTDDVDLSIDRIIMEAR